MSTIIVGDLHGKLALAQEVLKDKDQAVVFVGDYLDSFTIDIDTQIKLLDLILEACETRDNVQALFGNHEMSYLEPFKYKCSGFHNATRHAVQNRRQQMFKHFKWCTVVEDFLVTHAGVSQGWLPSDISSLKDIVDFINDVPTDFLMAVGKARGGFNTAVGGPLWCDSYFEFKPVKDVKQIFGHTQYRAPDQGMGILEEYENNFNIDCLDRCYEILEITNGVARIKTI